MTTSAAPLRPPSNNLASLFSEAITAILRVRYGKQTIGDPQSFREHMRRLLQTAMQEARNAGYTSAHIQMGVLATVGFLDESVLNLGSSGAAGNAAAAADWSRRPLQEELFGGHIAGETFFQNFAALLREDNSAQVADVLELHCHCLLLGYKGRYAFGNTGELAQLLRAAQEKISRTRGGGGSLLANPVAAPPPAIKRRDRWSRGLLYAAIGLAAAVVICFVLYSLMLRTSAGTMALVQSGDASHFAARPPTRLASTSWRVYRSSGARGTSPDSEGASAARQVPPAAQAGLPWQRSTERG